MCCFDVDVVVKVEFVLMCKLVEVLVDDYDVLFYLGGYGLLWDFVEDLYLIGLIECVFVVGKLVVVVCYVLGVLCYVKNL